MTLKDRVIVPPTDAIVAMDDTEIADLRIRLVDAAHAIETQIKQAWATGQPDEDWLVRSTGALAHMRRGLAVIKAEQAKRGTIPRFHVEADINDAFLAVDTVRQALKAAQTLRDAVKRFIEDDSDDNFAELERLVGVDD